MTNDTKGLEENDNDFLASNLLKIVFAALHTRAALALTVGI
jgi:hypothetical protein